MATTARVAPSTETPERERRVVVHGVVLVLIASALATVAFAGPRPHRGVADGLPPVVGDVAELALRVLLEPWMYLFFAGVLLLEWHRPIDRRQRLFGGGFRNDLLAWYGVNVALGTAVLAGIAHTLDLAHERLLGGADLDFVGWAGPLGIVGALIIADGLRWWTHWLRHRSRVLWAFHSVHHSQREMNAFTDVRSHLGDIAVAATLLSGPLLLLGASVTDLIVIDLVQRLYQRFYHANIRTNLGPLGAVLVTPQSHRIHHSSDPVQQRHNLGNLLTVWDRLFGTWWPDRAEYPAVTGVDGHGFPEESAALRAVPANYLRMQVIPLRLITARPGRAGRQASSVSVG